jgi:hypothetical protein
MQSGDGWTCKLDGHPASRHLHGDYLHATGQVPAGRELQVSEPVQLKSALPIADVFGWLEEYQYNYESPVDLRLKGSHFMQDLHLGDVSLSDLSDDQLKGLHYLVPCASHHLHSKSATAMQASVTEQRTAFDSFRLHID